MDDMSQGQKEQIPSFVPEVKVKASEAWKKPRLECILFCDYAGRVDDGKTMFAGCFDAVFFKPNEEKVTPFFFLYVKTAETREGNLQIAIIDPNETIVMAFGYDVLKEELKPDRPAVIQFLHKMRIPTLFEGIYWFDVSYRGESLGGTPLTVSFEKTEEGAKDENKETVNA